MGFGQFFDEKKLYYNTRKLVLARSKIMFNYSDFQAGLLRSFQFARPGCGRNEYRQGALNAAQARLFEQDVNRDGVLTLDEFVNAENYANQKEDALKGQSPACMGNYQDYVANQYKQRTMQIEAFKALDVNQDGVLDQRELANEISLMDKLGGRKDGIVSQRGFERLWCRPDSMRQIGAMLRDNYGKFNYKNIGMPWDKCGDYRSRIAGEIYNPFNLNSPMAPQMGNPFAQQLISPIAPQVYNPIGQMYNPIGYRPLAQSIYPNQINGYGQFIRNNLMLNGIQGRMNQILNMMRMLNLQNFAFRY